MPIDISIHLTVVMIHNITFKFAVMLNFVNIMLIILSFIRMKLQFDNFRRPTMHKLAFTKNVCKRISFHYM